ncbi:MULTISPECIES: single-stranded DNA-binding protein [unclassified Pseudonocardia]|uniref:single-stranded DNA-binding protein n=1 Tax=unclassified Pseudonocardia TaxID=2619320 RepID=UPI00076128D0|nr:MULTISPECIES: single-stranded DNA-binding protein [unclassified Pseudonocardia]
MSSNQITVVGNLTRKPQLRYTHSGRPVLDLTVAENYRRRDDSSGEWRDVAKTYYTVTCWRRLAEHAAQTLDKGHAVIVVGRLFVEEWLDRDNVLRKTPKIDPISVGLDLRCSPVLVPPRPVSGPDREPGRDQRPVDDWEVPSEALDGMTEDGDAPFGAAPDGGEETPREVAAVPASGR